MRKRIPSLLLGLGILMSGPIARAAEPQLLVNAISASIQGAIGTEPKDQIPGYSTEAGGVILNASGIECPDKITDIEQVTLLLRHRLAADFTGHLLDAHVANYPPFGDVVISATVRYDNLDVILSISVFKRASNHIFVYPVLVAHPTL